MPATPDDRAALIRALADRARESARREKKPFRIAKHVFAAVVTLSIVGLALQAFSAFLGAFQKVIEIESGDTGQTQAPVAASGAPAPVFYVETVKPEESPRPGAGDTPPAAP